MMRCLFFCVMTTLAGFGCTDEAESVVMISSDKEVESDTCQLFFQSFPSSFLDFEKLYSYTDHFGEGIYYEKSIERINVFFNCNEVNDSLKIKKCLQICIDGK